MRQRSQPGQTSRNSKLMMEDQLEDVRDETVLVVDPPRVRKININEKELRLFRITLRLFGLWHPPQAWWLERAVYPVVVNLSLVTFLAFRISSIIMIFGAGFFASSPSSFANEEFQLLSCCALLRLWLWIIHLLTIKYFKKRTLEQHILDLELHEASFNIWKGITTRLNVLLSISIVLTTVVIVLQICATYLYQLGMVFFGGIGLFGSFVCPWDLPIELSFTWVMFLLSKTSEVRLEQMQREFANWNEGVEDAIHHHRLHYSEKKRLSSKALSGIFVIHNVFMIVATPFLFHLIIEIIRNDWKLSPWSHILKYQVPILIIYLFVMLVCWIAPLYFAEQLAANETTFKETINDFCPGNMQPPVKAEGDTPTTFCSRQKVQLLLSYLQGKRMGFVVGGYSFQLKLSYLSFYLSLIVLAIKLLT